MKCSNCPFAIMCYSDQFAKGSFFVNDVLNVFWCRNCGFVVIKDSTSEQSYFIFECQLRASTKIFSLLGKAEQTSSRPLLIPDPAFDGRGDMLLTTNACDACTDACDACTDAFDVRPKEIHYLDKGYTRTTWVKKGRECERE